MWHFCQVSDTNIHFFQYVFLFILWNYFGKHYLRNGNTRNSTFRWIAFGKKCPTKNCKQKIVNKKFPSKNFTLTFFQEENDSAKRNHVRRQTWKSKKYFWSYVYIEHFIVQVHKFFFTHANKTIQTFAIPSTSFCKWIYVCWWERHRKRNIERKKKRNRAQNAYLIRIV